MKGDIMEIFKKNQLIEFVHLLGDMLGDNTEIVLHVIEEDHSYIAAIENGYISGRNKDSPLTELALSFIKNKVYVNNQYVKNYKGITKDNKQIRASTFFIKDEFGELDAMLCFNIDVTRVRNIANDILALENLSITDLLDQSINMVGPEEQGLSFNNNYSGEFIEYFSESLHDFFESIVSEKNVESLQLEQKIKIVQQLFDRGYFEIKGAVPQVAKLLKVSEPTVYRYLKQVDH